MYVKERGWMAQKGFCVAPDKYGLVAGLLES